MPITHFVRLAPSPGMVPWAPAGPREQPVLRSTGCFAQSDLANPAATPPTFRDSLI